MRDELAANLSAWLPKRGADGLWEDDGGAILPDHKLAQELYAPTWIGMPNKAMGGLKVSSKDDQRDVLGRSPDRADALALAVWEPLSLRVEQEDGEARPATHDEYEQAHGMGYRRGGEDVYAGAEWWRK